MSDVAETLQIRIVETYLLENLETLDFSILSFNQSGPSTEMDILVGEAV